MFKSGRRISVFCTPSRAAASIEAVKQMKVGNMASTVPRSIAWQTPEAAEMCKHSVVIAGHRTSISLETAFWQALLDIAKKQDVSANQLITMIDLERHGTLSSAIRLFVLTETLKAAEGTTE
jgi:predicted DNA-binding ribbon-helix-helix protein